MKRMYQDRDQSCSPPSKQARREDPQRGKYTLINTCKHILCLETRCSPEPRSFMIKLFFPCPPLVLLYVRTAAEEVFDALMLSTPTLSGLREAVSSTHQHIYLTRFLRRHVIFAVA